MWLLISITIMLFIIILIYMLKNKKINNNSKEEIGILVNNKNSFFPTIQIIENSAIVPNESNLIKDAEIKKAISLVDNSIVNSVVIGKNLKTSKKLLNNSRAFFSASKNGTENMLSVKGTNMVYGTQMKDGLFNANTKFTREDDLIKSASQNSLVNAGFGTASMIVGQYYMNEINNKLEILKENIQDISDFLDSEYQSRLAKIISKMQEIIDNKQEILNNEFSRNKRYDDILRLEDTCVELLGQANDIIKRNISKDDIDYKKYEKTLSEISKWFYRQQILQRLLLEIGNLRYVLAYGNETSKLSHTQYNNYLLQTNETNDNLEKWHNSVGSKLGIDVKELRRNAQLFKRYTIGLINEKWAYSKINDKTGRTIKNQTNIIKLKPYNNDKQDEVIKIQRYNGEYYNLIEKKTDKNII